MIIHLKDKHSLKIENFEFKCCIGKKDLLKKIEGDKKPPRGIYKIGNLYFRKDRIKKFETKIKNYTTIKKILDVGMI